MNMQEELIATAWTVVAVPLVAVNEEDKKEKEKKQPRLKDDRMNQPDGVSRLSLSAYFSGFLSVFLIPSHRVCKPAYLVTVP